MVRLPKTTPVTTDCCPDAEVSILTMQQWHRNRGHESLPSSLPAKTRWTITAG
jgi:hypothetical protein